MQRAAASVRGEPAVLVYSQTYEQELPGVPLDNLRGQRVLSALCHEGLVGASAVVRPGLVALSKLERVHAPAHLVALSSAQTIEATFGMAMAPALAQHVVTLQRRMTDGTVLAAWSAWRQHKLAVNLGGGFHHAQRDRGAGFCLINDVAVAIADLRARGMDERIAVIDLDLHDGDGTRAIFAEDSSVETFSIHNEHWGSTRARASTSIALGAEVDDATYLRTLRRELPAMLDQHRPRLVFYVAGCDGAADDEMGNWELSEAALRERDRFVISQLRARGIEAIVWVLAGGYGREAWRYSAAGLIAALGGPSNPRLPTTESMELSRYRHMWEAISPRDLSGVDPMDLEFDESDLFGVLPHGGMQLPPRVLDYYSRDGVEFGLERYGILPRLRKLGFEPRVEVQCDADHGDTIRVFGDETRELLLVECRVARDRQTMPGFELLRVEWLLLQNPRAPWTGGRRPLPGQTHPGLRMFNDVMMLMLLTCERTGLEGVLVVPSHYHVAAAWHGRMHFVEAEVEGRFRALERCLAPLNLAEASHAVELGRVRERETGARAYEPASLVLPVSERVHAYFDESWRERAALCEAETSFELA